MTPTAQMLAQRDLKSFSPGNGVHCCLQRSAGSQQQGKSTAERTPAGLPEASTPSVRPADPEGSLPSALPTRATALPASHLECKLFPTQCLQSGAMEHGDTNFQKLRRRTLIIRLSLQFLNFKIFWGLYRHSMPQLSTFGLFSGGNWHHLL